MTKLDVAKGGGARLSSNPEVKLRAMVEIAQNLARAVAFLISRRLCRCLLSFVDTR